MARLAHEFHFTTSTNHCKKTMMRETDELLPTTAARIVDPPRARPRALALTLAVALCAASAIAEDDGSFRLL